MKYIVSKNIIYRMFRDNMLIFNKKSYASCKLNKTASEILLSFADGKDIDEVYLKYKEDIPFDKFNSFIKDLAEKNLLSEQSSQIYQDQAMTLNEKVRVLSGEFRFLSSVIIETTYCCNEKCKHCYIDRRPEKELTTDEIKHLLDDLYELGVFKIVFTGGEFFVRKDSFQILEYARDKNFLIDIYTNGLMLDDTKLIRLAELGINRLHFSIYSSKASIHDEMTQIKGSFDKTISMARKASVIGIRVNLKTVIMTINKDDIVNIFSLGEKIGATNQITFSLRESNSGSNEPLKFHISEDDYIRIIKANPKLLPKIKIFSPENPLCKSFRTALSVNAYGSVFPCNSLKIVCGNIRDKSIKEIWKESKVLNELSKMTEGDRMNCQFCEKSSYCNFCPAICYIKNRNLCEPYFEACEYAAINKRVYEDN